MKKTTIWPVDHHNNQKVGPIFLILDKNIAE